MEATTINARPQAEAIMGLLTLFGTDVAWIVQDELNRLYAERLVVLTQNGNGGGNASEYADKLEEIIDAVGCGQLPEISIDIDSIAQEAADAAYEAARDAVNNASYDADASGELDDAQRQLTDALDAARELLAEMRMTESETG